MSVMPICFGITPVPACCKGATMTNNVTPLPLKADFRALVGRQGKQPHGTAVSRKPAMAPTAAPRQKRKAAAATVLPPAPPAAEQLFPTMGSNSETSNAVKPNVTVRHGADVLAYVVALGLAGAAAWFSIKGMAKLFPGDAVSVICMAAAMESAKLVTAGWLSRRWGATAWIWRLVLVVLVAALAVINAAGVYAQLVAAHVGERGAAQAAVQMQGANVDAKIEVAAARVADLDKQIAAIDNAVAAAMQRGKTQTALSAMEGQRKTRAVLADERNRAAATLAAAKAERAHVAAQGRLGENEAAPIVYVAEMLGVGTDSERAIRWLIALMVRCCDPLAIALTAAASARRSR
jgi:hypothetical protein